MLVWPAVPSAGGAGLRGESGAEMRRGSPLPSLEGRVSEAAALPSARVCKAPRLLLSDARSALGEPAVGQERAEVPGGPEVVVPRDPVGWQILFQWVWDEWEIAFLTGSQERMAVLRGARREGELARVGVQLGRCWYLLFPDSAPSCIKHS